MNIDTIGLLKRKGILLLIVLTIGVILGISFYIRKNQETHNKQKISNTTGVKLSNQKKTNTEIKKNVSSNTKYKYKPLTGDEKVSKSAFNEAAIIFEECNSKPCKNDFNQIIKNNKLAYQYFKEMYNNADKGTKNIVLMNTKLSYKYLIKQKIKKHGYSSINMCSRDYKLMYKSIKECILNNYKKWNLNKKEIQSIKKYIKYVLNRGYSMSYFLYKKIENNCKNTDTIRKMYPLFYKHNNRDGFSIKEKDYYKIVNEICKN